MRESEDICKGGKLIVNGEGGGFAIEAEKKKQRGFSKVNLLAALLQKITVKPQS